MTRELSAHSDFQPQVGMWFSALEQVRDSLVTGVENLSTEILAQRAFAGGNTIGTLLVHIAEAELFWMQEVVTGEPLTPQQRDEYRFDVFGRKDAPQMEPRDFGYIRKRLDLARSVTRSSLQPVADHDLSSVRRWKSAEGSEERTFTVAWIIHHVLEHEAHHRGQIFMLRSALGH